MKKAFLFILTIFLAYITAFYTTGKENVYTKLFNFGSITEKIDNNDISETEQSSDIENGIKQLQEEDYNKALTYFFYALDENDNSITNYYIGHTYLLQEKYEDAMYFFNIAIEKDAKNADAYLDKGIVQYYKNSYNDAIGTLYYTTELNPEISKTYYYLSLCYEKNNKLNVALQSVETAIEKDSLYSEAWFKAAHIAFDMDSFNISKKYYIKYLKLATLNKFGLLNLGLTYSYLNKNDSAIFYYNKVIANYPKYSLAYNNKGYIYQKEKEYEEAIKNYSVASQLDNKGTRSVWNRADCYCQLKKYNKAIKDYKKVSELNSDFFNTLYQIGECYEKLNNKKEALNYYQLYQSNATSDATYFENVIKKIKKLS